MEHEREAALFLSFFRCSGPCGTAMAYVLEPKLGTFWGPYFTFDSNNALFKKVLSYLF